MIESTNPEIDVDDLRKRITEEVSKRRKNFSPLDVISSNNFNSFGSNTSKNNINIAYIEALIKNAELRAYIRSKIPEKFNKLPLDIGNLLGKFILKIFNLLFKDQREVNFNLIQSLKESVAINKQLSEEISILKMQLQQHLISTENNVQALKHHIDNRVQQISNCLDTTDCSVEQVAACLDTTDSNLQQVAMRLDTTDNSVQQVVARLDTTDNSVQQVVARLDTTDNSVQQIVARLDTTDSSIQSMDYKVKALEKRCQYMDERYIQNDSYLKNDLSQQKRLITLFLEEARKNLPQSLNENQIQDFVDEHKHSLDALYVAFEDQFRGSKEEINERLRFYLPLIEEAKIGKLDTPILDVGCGRGEWLELLRESGYSAKGIDTNRVMLEQCRSRDLEVIEEDVIKCMQSLPDGSLGAVTGFHIIEHLAFEDILKLFTETLRVLKPQGLVIFETPNPENVLVGSHNFYIDPTHRNPLPSITIKFLAEFVGLCRVNILKLHPYPDTLKLSGSAEAERFNDYFYGAQDYAVVGYKI